MKLSELYESAEVDLIGKTIGGRTITDKIKKLRWSGEFRCSEMNLTSLNGCPEIIKGDFMADTNLLKSLKHSPKNISGGCYINNNKIESLEDLDLIVGGDFSCAFNKIESLKDVHKYVKKIDGTFYANSNPIKSHVLGLLKIVGVTHVTLNNDDVKTILNKYLKQPFGNGRVLGAQSELLDAGFDDFAQL